MVAPRARARPAVIAHECNVADWNDPAGGVFALASYTSLLRYRDAGSLHELAARFQTTEQPADRGGSRPGIPGVDFKHLTVHPVPRVSRYPRRVLGGSGAAFARVFAP